MRATYVTIFDLSPDKKLVVLGKRGMDDLPEEYSASSFQVVKLRKPTDSLDAVWSSIVEDLDDQC